LGLVSRIRTYARPQLREPVLIAAFAGWNDASEVATFAVQFLIDQWNMRKLAEIDPEEFYVFTETRPQVRIPGRFQRHIEWPANEIFYHVDKEGERDVLVLLGVEPDLKWRTYVDALTGFLRQQGVTTVVTLGALVADVAHTLPVRLTGTGSPAPFARRLRRVGVEATRYAGPTGINGVINSAAARKRFATASIWGSIPEYLSASPNPKVALAMLKHLSDLLDLTLDLSELQDLEKQFDRQVSEIVAEDPELQAYVEQLEARRRAEQPVSRRRRRAEQEQLPSSEELIRDLEEYLRRRRGGGDQEP
jgi:proteasome assembly chaperone (PAC2) family protein